MVTVAGVARSSDGSPNTSPEDGEEDDDPSRGTAQTTGEGGGGGWSRGVEGAEGARVGAEEDHDAVAPPPHDRRAEETQRVHAPSGGGPISPHRLPRLAGVLRNGGQAALEEEEEE